MRVPQAQARARLHALVNAFKAGEMDTQTFCAEFETTYNLDLDKRELSPAESTAFAQLFEKVVWYSPYPEERAKIPNYLGGDEIMEAVEKASRDLEHVE